ncbi:MAG: IS1 family transposase [Alphaproteobacteria bacterium]|nr:IS1 family transposase [Alphaproteobacteria bacterium]
MNRLPLETRVQILSMLVEGSSMRAVSRIAKVSINTVTKLLVDAGTVAAAYHDEKVREVHAKRVQCDEIWSFCYAKQKNASAEMKAAGTAGDVWTWTTLDSDSKLIVTWRVGGRDRETGADFMHDVAFRLADRVQLTADGFPAYPHAVEKAFGKDVDFAQLVKIYQDSASRSPEKRYSPAVCVGAHKDVIRGKPDQRHISTSHVERQNLTMRMSMRRFTRLTNAHSKKVENHCHALALYFLHYNWMRPNQALQGKTPAMAANLAKAPLTMADLVAMVDRAGLEERLGIYSN